MTVYVDEAIFSWRGRGRGMTLLEWALTYARRGWPVFPCHPKDKRPLVKGDPDPDDPRKVLPGTGGVRKASTDEAQIRAWWRQWPEAMIGLACGPVAGVFVLDLDAGADRYAVDQSGALARGDDGKPVRAGQWELDAIVAALETHLGIALADTWTVATPRGGRHLYYRYPADAPHSPSTDGRPTRFGNGRGALPSKLLLPVDVRGGGGYVILPPSARPDGVAYRWVTKPKPSETLPPNAPAALVDCLESRGRFAPAKPKPARRSALVGAPEGALAADIEDGVRHYADRAMEAELARLSGSIKGERNENLFHAALRLAQLVAAGALDAGVAREGLEAVIRGWPSVRKSRATIESGWGKGIREPRDLAAVRADVADRLRRYGRAGNGVGDAVPLPASPADYGLPDVTLPLGSQRARMGGLSDDGSAAFIPPAEGGDAAHGGPDGAIGDAGGQMPPPPDGPPHGPSGGEEPDGDGGGHGDDKAALDLRLAFFPLTDLGNAERFRERNRGHLLWCPELGWLWWDGKRWNREGADGKVRMAEHRMVRAISDEAAALRTSGRDEVVGLKAKQPLYRSDILESWARTSEDSARMSPIAKHAGPYLEIASRRLDADRFAINVLNGTLHCGVRDGSAFIDLRPHNPADHITKLAPVVYDPQAEAPVYDKFLAEVQPKPDMRRFLAQWGGYSLLGDVGEQRLVFFWGGGRNGKSTLVDAWGLLAGDYGTAVPIETFLNQGNARRGDQASPDLALLKGRRFVRASEPDKGAKLGEALIKVVTGGEPFQARELHKPFFTLEPQFKLTISGNHKPRIVGTDEGIWRRMTLVPWTVTIAKDKVDKQLGAKLTRELPGILNRLLDGLRDWLERGLILPDDVVEATEEYRRDSDPCGRFLDACVVPEAGGQVQSSVLHRVFCAWCKANGEREWTMTGFGNALRDRGFEKKKSDTVFWLNIRMIKTEDDFVDHAGNVRVRNPDGEDASPNDVVPL